MYVYVVCF
uniref:Uncharacterized protein n=1 Tax=blood disease bacterium R229 TaxID=741978 RepID=G2ZNG2_9RALS|nr:hypothetical protein BDB_110001 [blood disease bacterium R229]